MVLPEKPKLDLVYEAFADAILHSQGAIAKSWRQSPYLIHLLLREFGLAVPFSTGTLFWMFPEGMLITDQRPPLRHHIDSVIFNGTDKQMGWVAARFDIACMANQQRVGVLAVVQEIRNAVCEKQGAANTEDSVPCRTACTNPRPAFIGPSLINVFLETRDVPGRKFRQRLTIKLGHVGSSYEPIRLAVAGVSALATAIHLTPNTGEINGRSA